MTGNNLIVKWVLLLSALVLPTKSVWSQSKHASLYAMSAKGENVRLVALLEDFPSVGSPSVSPDGKRVAFDGWRTGENSGQGRLFIVDVETSAIQSLGPGLMPTWSRDGKYLAFTSNSPRGVFVRSADGVAKKQIDPDGWGIQWSPDGTKLAYPKRGAFEIYDLLTDEKRTVQPNPEAPYTYIYYNSDWSPDSKKLCFKGRRPDGGYDAAIVDVSKDKPELIVCFDATKGYSNEFAWHPDGDRIVLIKQDKPAQLHEFAPKANVTPQPVAGQPKDQANVACSWSLDGKTLYFVGRKP